MFTFTLEGTGAAGVAPLPIGGLEVGPDMALGVRGKPLKTSD